MSMHGKRVVTTVGWAGLLGLALVVGQGKGAGHPEPGSAAAEEGGVSGGLRGVWTAERSTWRVQNGGTTTLVELSLRRVSGKGHWNSSETLPLAELRGLAAPALEAASADVRFDWTRDAGTFACQGRFERGVGAGHFTFAGNPEYAADMKRRGYGEIDEEKALRLALHDVSRSFIDELKRLGYERVSLDEVVSLRIHGASIEYVKGLASLGYRALTVDQLTSLRIHGASLEFVREIQSLGYGGLPTDKLVSFRIHGVSPGYVRGFRALGYEQLTPDQLVSMRIHGVSPEFAKELGELGYERVAVDDLVSMRIHGVTTEFVKKVQGRSGKAVDVDRLVSMRIHGQE
jgi:hypothetical protein